MTTKGAKTARGVPGTLGTLGTLAGQESTISHSARWFRLGLVLVEGELEPIRAAGPDLGLQFGRGVVLRRQRLAGLRRRARGLLLAGQHAARLRCRDRDAVRARFQPARRR